MMYCAWILLCMLHSASWSTVSANCSKNLAYQFTFNGKSLVDHTFATIPSKQEIECPLHCHEDERCISYTFDEQRLVCNLSDSDHTMHPKDLMSTPHAIYRSIQHQCTCTSNSIRCKINYGDGTYRCDCKPGFSGKNCEEKKIFSSCQDAFNKTRSLKNSVYHIQTDQTVTAVYCYMEDIPGCGGGGWTTVMKTDGNKNTFGFSSSLWTNKSPYEVNNGQSGIDGKETKLPTYWTLPFDNLCLGMKTADQHEPKWILVKYKASSLYSLIADDKYRSTSIGRIQWKSLINGSSLQLYCNREGFNLIAGSIHHTKVRIGILRNDQNDCHSPDSYVGFGGRGYECGVTTGNCGWGNGDNGKKQIAAYGIILGK